MTQNEIHSQLAFLPITETIFTAQELFDLAEKSYTNASPWSVETFQKDLKQPFVHYYVATLSGALVGFIGYRQLFEEVEITNIVVADEMKGKGIGRALLENWLNGLRKLQIDVVHLEVRKSNKVAQQLYKKMGFQMINIRQDYYDYPVEDALVMSAMFTKDR